MTDAQIKALANSLSGDAARKSIDKQLGKPYTKEWSALRQAFNINGWETVEETENHLRKMFKAKS